MLKRFAFVVPLFLLGGCGLASGQIDPLLVANNSAGIEAASVSGPTYGHLDIEKYLRMSLANLPMANPAAGGGSFSDSPSVPAISAQADVSAMSDVQIYAQIDANEALIADTGEYLDTSGRVRHSQKWLDKVNAIEAAYPALRDQGEFLKSVSSRSVAQVHLAFRQDLAGLDSKARSQRNSQWRAGQPDDRLAQFESRYAQLFGPSPAPSADPVPQPSPIGPAPAPSPSDAPPAPSGFLSWL